MCVIICLRNDNKENLTEMAHRGSQSGVFFLSYPGREVVSNSPGVGWGMGGAEAGAPVAFSGPRSGTVAARAIPDDPGRGI